MRLPYPLTIISDRYSGCYSGGDFLAFNLQSNEIPSEIYGDDCDASLFWIIYNKPCGKGITIDEAINDLIKQLPPENIQEYKV